MEDMNLNQLRTFVRVAELGSFSAAAEVLGLTQPAVSLQVRSLERALGIELVERVGRKACPTAAGTRVLAHVGRLEDSLSAMMDAARHRASPHGGRLRIGTGATACIYFLPPILEALRKKFPSVEMVVQTGNTREMVKAVHENMLDLCLATMPVSGRELEVVPIREDPFVLIGAPDLPLPAKATPKSVAALPILLFEQGGNTRLVVDRWLRKSRTPFEPTMSLGSVEALKRLAAAGLGYAIVPAMAVEEELAKGSLRARAFSPPLKRTLAIVLRRDKRLTPWLREIVDKMKIPAAHRQG